MKLNKILIISLIIGFPNIVQVSAQSYLDQLCDFTHREIIDKSTFECIYTYHRYDCDIEAYQTSEYILQIGKNIVQYKNYGEYCRDSVLVIQPDQSEVTNGFYNSLAQRYRIGQPFSVIFERSSKRIEIADRLFSRGEMKYSEAYLPINWKISNEEKIILSHICRKATATFRGREWTVWYAAAIKQSYGPWRLWGPPGLVLEAEDSTGTHYFEAVAIRNNSSNIVRDNTNQTAKIVTREKFRQIDKDARLNGLEPYWKAHREDPVHHPAPFAKHLMYTPYELE